MQKTFTETIADARKWLVAQRIDHRAVLIDQAHPSEGKPLGYVATKVLAPPQNVLLSVFPGYPVTAGWY